MTKNLRKIIFISQNMIIWSIFLFLIAYNQTKLIPGGPWTKAMLLLRTYAKPSF